MLVGVVRFRGSAWFCAVEQPDIEPVHGTERYENAGMPVMAFPRINVWISLVPS
jgi:hypothetical protein